MRRIISFYLPKYSLRVFFVLIIIFYFFNGIMSIRSLSLTYDEASFYNYAVRYLKGNPDRINPVSDNSKMPISIINTIPRIVKQYVLKQKVEKDNGVQDIINGRYITLCISVLILFFVFFWAMQLYGKEAGLLAMLLCSLCPNNLGSAVLVTTDAYSSLFLLMTMYFLWRYCISRKSSHFILYCFSIAIAQLVKQSLFHLYIISIVTLIIFNWDKIKVWRKIVTKILLFVSINFIVLNIGYYFHGSFTKLGSYHFKSDLFLQLQQVFYSWLPLPFPSPFIEGLDMAKYYDQIGGGLPISSFGNVTILNKSFTGRGVWYYYFITLFYKTPITYLIFFVWTLFIYLINKSRNLLRNELFLFVPVIYFLIAFSFFYQTQCGIRHIIFLFPFLFIFLGQLFYYLKTHLAKLFFGSSILFLIYSISVYRFNYYSYTNEFIQKKKNAYKYVGASNIDFGQGGNFLQKYYKYHPNVVLAPSHPMSGLFYVPLSDFVDIWNKGKYSWMKNYQPIGHISHCYLLFEINK